MTGGRGTRERSMAWKQIQIVDVWEVLPTQHLANNKSHPSV